MYLLIDWGNTYLKFIEIADLTEQSLLAVPVQQVETAQALLQQTQPNYQAILLSSVRNEQDTQALQYALGKLSEQLFVAQTNAVAQGVTCAYSQPELLGIDRWLAVLVAAEGGAASGVISIGTAITLDIVKNRQHLGGQIIPGQQLLFQALKSTDKVNAKQQLQRADEFALGTSTTECVHAGIETLLFSYLESLIQFHSESSDIKHWIFSGGGGEFWSEKFQQRGRSLEFRPRIVFEGLLLSYLAANR